MHYRNAPITEAIIDIKVQLASDLDPSKIEELGRLVSSDYPRAEKRTLNEATLVFGAETSTRMQQIELGSVFFDSDNKQVVQFRVDGFTFSRLQPYETWERLQMEARRLWNLYKNLVGPLKITRIAVRYINRFDFPGPNVELEDYLTIFPQISKELPSKLRDTGPFSMTVLIPQADLKGTLIINESVAVPTTPNTIPIILDLDLFVDNPAVGDEESLWSTFEGLRERKNLYFESFITNKTRELIS